MSASAVLNLQKAGFSTEQVEALAAFLDTQACSKSDLIAETAPMKADIAVLKADVAVLKTDMSKVKAELATLRWMVGFLLAMSAAIMVKLFTS